MSYGLNLGLGGTYRGLYRVLGDLFIKGYTTHLVQGSYSLGGSWSRMKSVPPPQKAQNRGFPKTRYLIGGPIKRTTRFGGLY